VRQILIETARLSDCRLTEEIAEAIFPPLGLTEDQVGEVAQEMLAAGEAEISGGAFVLSSEPCGGVEVAPVVPAVPPVSPLMARVIEVFRQNGCTMTEETGMPALAAAGISEADLDSLRQETEALVEARLVVRDEAALTIRIAEPLCSGAVVAADPAEPLIRMLEAHGCALTQEEAEGLVADYGITLKVADEMADSLMERGLARQEGSRLVLEGCGG
jgi:hypothetical protein